MEEKINEKYLDVEPLQIADDIVRFHGMNPGGSCINGNNNFLVGTGNVRVLIDWGACIWPEEQTDKFVKSVLTYLDLHKITLSHIIATHYHYDHIGAIPNLINSLSDLGADTSEIIVAKKFFDEPYETKIFDRVKDKCTIQNLEDGDTIQLKGKNHFSKI